MYLLICAVKTMINKRKWQIRYNGDDDLNAIKINVINEIIIYLVV